MSIEGNRSEGGMFSPGEILYASKLNDLAQLAGYGRQWHSTANLVAQGPFGTVDLSGAADAGIGNNIDFPYKITVAAGVSEGDFKVYVRAGTVNSVVSKAFNGPMAGKYLDEVPQPYLELNSGSGIKYVVLRCTSSGGKFFPNTTDVYLVDSLEALIDSSTEGHLLIASISLGSSGGKRTISSINQYIYSSQGLVRVNPGGAEGCVWSWTSR